MPSGPRIRVVVLGDDPLARAGLASLAATQPGLEVVAEQAARSWRPTANTADVALWDLGGTRDGELATEDVAALGIPVVVLAPDARRARAALAAGARGALERDADGERIAAALAAATSGLVVLDPVIAAALRPVAGIEAPTPSETLTPRELEVLQLLARGLSNKDIAQRLGISEHTAKFHVNAILSKLDAHGRTDAVVRAARLGLVVL